MKIDISPSIASKLLGLLDAADVEDQGIDRLYDEIVRRLDASPPLPVLTAAELDAVIAAAVVAPLSPDVLTSAIPKLRVLRERQYRKEQLDAEARLRADTTRPTDAAMSGQKE